MKASALDKPRPAATVSLKLDSVERDRIAALARIKRRTPHYLMKEAILAYVRQEEARQNFIAAAEASFAHYKETGLHVSADEFSAWVDAVQTYPAAVMPKCHT